MENLKEDEFEDKVPNPFYKANEKAFKFDIKVEELKLM